MLKNIWFTILMPVLLVALVSSGAFAADDEILRELQTLKQRMAVLEQKLIERDAVPQQIGAVAVTEQDTATIRQVVEEVVAANKSNFKIGGAIRFNYAIDDFDETSKEKSGDLKFDLFRIDVDGSYDDLFYSAQYRWNSYQDFVHHAYFGYNFDDTLSAQLGVTAVPFANAYETHNFWAGIPYYIGLADDFDMGVKIIKKAGPWNFQLAFFKNGEWGSSSKLARYSYDVANTTTLDKNKNTVDWSNEEVNQFNGRVAYTFDHGNLGKTEIGFSAQWGQLYNDATGDMGDHQAFAVHLDGYYGPFNIRFEAADYEYNAENPAGVTDDYNDVVRMGAFSDSFEVAAEGTVYAIGLSYDVPVSWGPISMLTFYDDYSILDKAESRFENSEINTVGCMVTSGPVYTYFDVISGKNAAYLGGDSGTAFGAGDKDADWGTKFNVNIAYYF